MCIHKYFLLICFILTMRNVNKEAVYKVLHGADSFILTMRNVNIIDQIGEIKDFSVLY